jgi:hypothetical protein
MEIENLSNLTCQILHLKASESVAGSPEHDPLPQVEDRQFVHPLTGLQVCNPHSAETIRLFS